MNNNVSLRTTTVGMTHFATVCATRARVTRVQDFVSACWDCYRVPYTVDYTTLKVMNASRWKECNSMYTGSCKGTYHDTVFEKVTPVYKKSPRDSPRARVSPVDQPRNFYGLGTRYNRLQLMNPSRTNIKTTLLPTIYRCVLRLST